MLSQASCLSSDLVSQKHHTILGYAKICLFSYFVSVRFGSSNLLCSGVARGVCDASFESCAESICEEQVDENKCKEQANLDRIMLNVAGCGKYTASQVDVCQCVAKEDVDKHREAAVEAFYALHNPSNIDKAKGLAEKATTKQKYATLMLKLVNKYYPDVIDVREDPEKKRMQAVVDEQVEKQEKKKGEQSESSSDDTATEVDEMDYEL